MARLRAKGARVANIHAQLAYNYFSGVLQLDIEPVIKGELGIAG